MRVEAHAVRRVENLITPLRLRQVVGRPLGLIRVISKHHYALTLAIQDAHTAFKFSNRQKFPVESHTAWPAQFLRKHARKTAFQIVVDKPPIASVADEQKRLWSVAIPSEPVAIAQPAGAGVHATEGFHIAPPVVELTCAINCQAAMSRAKRKCHHATIPFQIRNETALGKAE